MAYERSEYPEVNSGSFDNARLFHDRKDMIRKLGIPRQGVICELGVANGDFSEFLFNALDPATFVAADLFEMHHNPVIWGIPQNVLFHDMTHHDYYRSRFSHESHRLQVIRGLSHEVMEGLPDQSMDMIYIDAGHSYVSVKQDIDVCIRKVKPDGFLIFNDYVLYDPFTNDEYGVVPAVNELLAGGEWDVAGFALQRHMFCDIAIKRKT